MLDLTKEMMTVNGIPVKYRSDLIVFEGAAGRIMVVDREGVTSRAKVQKIVPKAANALELQKAAEKRAATYGSTPEQVVAREAARLARKEATEQREIVRVAKEKDRMSGLKKVMGRLPVGYQLTFSKAATQIAKHSGENQTAVFWWLVDVSNKKPNHPAREYMVDAGEIYASLFNPG